MEEEAIQKEEERQRGRKNRGPQTEEQNLNDLLTQQEEDLWFGDPDHEDGPETDEDGQWLTEA